MLELVQYQQVSLEALGNRIYQTHCCLHLVHQQKQQQWGSQLPDPERFQTVESAPDLYCGVRWGGPGSKVNPGARGRLALLDVGELNLYPLPVGGSAANCLEQQMLATQC